MLERSVKILTRFTNAVRVPKAFYTVLSDSVVDWEICIQTFVLHATAEATSRPSETLYSASASASSYRNTKIMRTESTMQHSP